MSVISHDLDWELSKIGTNINQIAKICNTQKYVEPSELEKLDQEIDEIKLLLREVLKKMNEVIRTHGDYQVTAT